MMASQQASQAPSKCHRFSATRRDPSKHKQRKHTAAPEQSQSGRNRLLVLVLSSCLLFSVAALGLLLAPLIARRYLYLESQSDAYADGERESSLTPLVLDAPRSDQRYHRPPRRYPTTPMRASGHSSFADEVVPPPKRSIFCVLEAKTAARDAAASTPYRFCSHVVVCCGAVDHSWLDVEGDSLSAAVAQLRSRHPYVKRVLGIGGPTTNAAALDRAIENRATRAELATNVVETLNRLGFDWGSLVHVPCLEQLKRPEALGLFVRALCVLAAQASLRTAALLPADPDIEADVYEDLRELNASHYLILIKMAHATDARRFSTAQLPCSIPDKFLRSAGTAKYAERVGKDNASASQGFEVFVSLSAAAFEFVSVTEGSAATEVKFRRTASRAELCGVKGWNVSRSDGCVVASSGSLSRVAMDPQSDMGSWRKAHGVVIFDMKLDDTRGKCGPPYSFTRSVYFALESHAGR